ncbi:CD40 ligand [Chanos chanos]|uniref:CD40 ligand n=1 Tax=Chanos chanos TaxID=29144 RepID=A0A6J2UQ72_CHACN|nr:CD40 ligand [Chanos chanos]
MINTFHSTLPPPPVPPRTGYAGSKPNSNSSLVKFLSVVLLLLMLLTFGGFFYLFSKTNTLQSNLSNHEDFAILKRLQECEDSTESKWLLNCKELVLKYKSVLDKVLQAEGTAAKIVGESSPETFAHLKAMPKQQSTPPLLNPPANTLLWDREHSVFENVDLSSTGTLTIRRPGTYYIFSQVTFSAQHARAPLRQFIMSKTKKKQEGEPLLKSYCSLSTSRGAGFPDLCTSSQAGVFKLEAGQQLYINVTDRDLVNTESSFFGLFML